MVNRTLNRLSVLFLLLLGTLPQISLLCSTLELGVHPRLWLWIAGAALCLWISACFRRGLLLGMPAAALLLYRAYRFFDSSPLTELDDLGDKFSGAYFHAYIAPDAAYNYLNAAEDHSFVLLLIAFLLMAYLASGLTSHGGRRFLCFLGSVPLPAAVLAVNGLAPAAPVVAMLVFWALLLVSGNYSDEGCSGRLVFGYSLPLLFLICGVLAFNRPEDYRYEETESVVTEQLNRLGDWLLEQMEPASEQTPLAIPQTVEASPETLGETANTMLWESDGGGMDLTQNYTPQMLQTLFLRVNADHTGLLYLRGISYGDYTGTGWEPAEAAPLSSLAFTAGAVDAAGNRRQLSLQTITPLRYALLPYYSAIAEESDSSVPSALQRARLSYTAYAGDFSSLAAEATAEAQYRDYAHSVYTRLPQETRTAMLNLAAEAGLDIRSGNLIEDVANYIRSAGEYDLETEPYPSADYAVWFLTQAHRGYCVHFATAATAMYRALGIPARITEGFLLRTAAGRYVDVRGENAHAWVEIYRDGVGWIPVEVTGQSGLNPMLEESEASPAPEENEDPEETPDDGQADSQENETTAPQPVSSAPESGGESLPVGIVQPQPQKESGMPHKAFPWRALCMTLLFLAAVSLWPLLQREIWRHRLSSADHNRAVIAVYRRAQLLSRIVGSVPGEIQKCAEKAFFSAQGVSPEEARRCLAVWEEALRAHLDALPLLKRLFCRYVYGLF